MYVKLFGGPLDGQSEGVTEGCTGLRLKYPRYAYLVPEGETPTYHHYKQSPEDPQYFIYDGPAE